MKTQTRCSSIATVVAVGLFICQIPAYADSGATETLAFLQEERSAMASAKMMLKVDESPNAVTVMTHEEIRNAHAATLGDLLGDILGVHSAIVNDYQRMVGIRGLQGQNSSKTLILLDGAPLNIDWFGTTQWNSIPVPLIAIERIEVVKSPGTLYGANAFAGVVNIVTRREKKKWLAEGEGMRGNGKTESAQGILGIHTDDTQVSVSGRIFRSNFSQPDPLPNISLTNSTYFENASDMFQGNASQKWGDRNTTQLSAGFSAITNSPMLMNPGSMHMVGDGRSQYLVANHEFKATDNYSLKGMISSSQYDMLHRAHIGMAESRVIEQTNVVSLDQTLRFHNDDQLLIGIESTLKKTQSSPSNPAGAPISSGINPGISQRVLNRDVDNLGWAAYLQEVHPFAAAWKMFLGSRYDHNWYKGDAVAGFGSLVWRPDPTRYWRINSNTAYRFPNVYELFGDFDYRRSTEQLSLHGSENLKPERVISLETGAGKVWARRLKTDVSLYNYWITDSIAIDIASFSTFQHNNHIHPGASGNYINDPSARAMGGEFQADWTVTPWLRLLGDYSHQKLWGGKNIVVETMPRDLSHLGAEYHLGKKFTFLTQWEHIAGSTWRVFPDGDSRNELSPVELFNIRATYRRDSVGLGIRWDNIFDKDYNGFPAASAHGTGRSIGERFMAIVEVNLF